MQNKHLPQPQCNIFPIIFVYTISFKTNNYNQIWFVIKWLKLQFINR